jgi:dihydroorotate dehydrogenase
MSKTASSMEVKVGSVRLKNPVLCGAGEHLIEAEGMRSALDKGAAAVFMKSTNESEAARSQLDRSDYALLDSEWRRLPWNFEPPRDASLFCRSGLAPQPFERWLDLMAETDAYARERDAYVVPSLIPADLSTGLEYARRMQEAGARALELNVAASHADEAAKGALTLERDASRVQEIVRRFREVVGVPLWVKLTGQSGSVTDLAEAARAGGADSVILAGRFMAFVPDVETMRPLLGTSAGFGGPWALPITCRWLAEARRRLGPSFPLVGTNGARSGLDVVRFLLAGASAVQMTTAVFTAGFGVIERSIEVLQDYLAAHGRDAASLVGAAADALASYADQPERRGYWREFVPEGSVSPD